MEPVRSHLAVFFACSWVALAHAQPLPDDPFPHDADDASDPIGLDDDARSLDRIAAERVAPRAEAKAVDLSFGPEPPVASARAGEILTAVPAVREGSHRVRVTLEPGLARIEVELTLTSTADKPSEALYRLRLPPNAWLAGVTVCNARGCRDGVEEHAPEGRSAYDAAVLARANRQDKHAPLPVAHAQLDREHAALLLRAAPITQQEPLTLRVRYEADAPMHGGTVRLSLPSRGMDPRAAQTEVVLEAPELLDARVGGQAASFGRGGAPEPLVTEPWTALLLTAHARANAAPIAQLQRMRCDGAPCVRARAWAGPRELAPRDIIVMLDASPSTEGPARGRLLAAIAAILDAAPSGSRARALAFAARAEPIIAKPVDPGMVALAPFAPHIENESLGAATRFDSAWALAESWLNDRETRAPSKLRPLVVVVGDGGLSVRAEHAGDRSTQRAFARAKKLGVEVSAVNVADRGATTALLNGVQLTGGVVIGAGAAAELAARGREREPLQEQIGALFAPTVGRAAIAGVAGLGALRAGEALLYMGPSSGHTALQWSTSVSASARRSSAPYSVRASTPLVAADPHDIKSAQQLALKWPNPPVGTGKKTRCDRRGPPSARGGLSSDEAPVALAEERACAVAQKAKDQANAALGKGMPADPLLDMLRHRVLPFARDCFRHDRAGKSDYELRAVFVFSLAEREVISADVEGRIPETLRQCLMGAVDTLDVPRFTGTVEVRYPLVTESAPKAEQIQLTQVAAKAVDALLRDN